MAADNIAEGAARRLLLKVLEHRAITDCADLEALEKIASTPGNPRHQLRASSILAKHRAEMARLLAHIDAVREETLHAKGLSKTTTHVRHSLDLGALPVEQLRRLAQGAAQSPEAPTIEARAEVVRQDNQDAEHAPETDPPGPA